MLRRQFGQMAVALPAAGLLAAHQADVASRASSASADKAGSANAPATFTNAATTIAPGWIVASPSMDPSGTTDTTHQPSPGGLQAVFAYPTPLNQGELSDLRINCANFGGSDLGGVAAIGSVNAISLRKVGVYKAPGDGFSLQQDTTTGNVPDSWLLETCVVDASTYQPTTFVTPIP